MTKKSAKSTKKIKKSRNVQNFGVWSGAEVCKSCRYRKMLKNDYLLAKIGVDTGKNEPPRVRHRVRPNTAFERLAPVTILSRMPVS